MLESLPILIFFFTLSAQAAPPDPTHAADPVPPDRALRDKADSAAPARRLACQDYRPGDFIKPADFVSVMDYLWEFIYSPTVKAEDLKRYENSAFPTRNTDTWNQLVNTELTAAALEVLTNPKTKVIMGSFTDPADRARQQKNNKSEHDFETNPDHGTGLRVIYQLEVGGKLLSVLTFWKYDSAQQKMVLVGGPDALRVRAEIPPFTYDAKADTQPWLGLAYDVGTDTEGKVKTMEPLNYFTPTGDRKYPWTDLSAEMTCYHCHGDRRNRAPGDPPAGHTPYGEQDFLNYVKEKENAPAQVVTSLKTMLDNARGEAKPEDKKPLIPEGLVELLRENCRKFAADKTIPETLDAWRGNRDLDSTAIPETTDLPEKLYDEFKAYPNAFYLYHGEAGEKPRFSLAQVNSVDKDKREVDITLTDLNGGKPTRRTVPETDVAWPIDSALWVKPGVKVKTPAGQEGNVNFVFSDGTVRITPKEDGPAVYYSWNELTPVQP